MRSLVETKLANALLKGDLADVDGVRFLYDREADEVRWEKPREEAAGPPPRARGAQPQRAAH